MNTSSMFKLNGSDLVKGGVVAVLAAVLTAVHNAVMAHGLNVAAYQWDAILYVGFMAGVGYLTKNFISDKEGKVLGSIG